MCSPQTVLCVCVVLDLGSNKQPERIDIANPGTFLAGAARQAEATVYNANNEVMDGVGQMCLPVSGALIMVT